MSEKILVAITGGLFTGKTTLAEYLRDEHGFKYISYTDMLKTFAQEALHAVGLDVSIAEMKANKEKYRAFIIALGHLIDFDNGYGLEELADTIRAHAPHDNIVLDNVRFEAQMDILERHGFRMLRVVTPIQERRRRARAVGLGLAEFNKRVADPTEQPLVYRPGEIQVMGNGNLHAVYQQIIDAYQVAA